MKKDHAALQIVNLAGFLVPRLAGAGDDIGNLIKHVQRSFQQKRTRRFGAAMENGGKAVTHFISESILEIPMQAVGGNQYIMVHRLHAV